MRRNICVILLTKIVYYYNNFQIFNYMLILMVPFFFNGKHLLFQNQNYYCYLFIFENIYLYNFKKIKNKIFLKK